MKIGFTCSAFDLLHAGHIQMLRDAKSQCDYLICGLQVDPAIDRETKNSPVQTLVERYIQLAAVKYVDGPWPCRGRRRWCRSGPAWRRSRRAAP